MKKYFWWNMRSFSIVLFIALMSLAISAFGEEVQNVAGGSSPEKQSLRLSLEEYVRMVVQKNNSIVAQRFEFMISRDNIMREQASFEPEFVNSFHHGEERLKYSQDQKSQLLFASETEEITDRFNAMIRGKMGTGAEYKFGFTDHAYQDEVLDEDVQHKSYLGVEVTQPLFKNAGASSRTGLRTAEKDTDISFQAYRKRMMEVAYGALTACWDYYAARERLKIRKGSLEVAEKLLEVNKERVRLGKMARSELMEAESGVAVRKSWETKARQELVTAVNNIRSYLSESDVDQKIELRFGDLSGQDEIMPDFDSSMQRALDLMPDYQAALQKIEKEKLLIAYAKNQRWPNRRRCPVYKPHLRSERVASEKPTGPVIPGIR